MNKLFVIWYIRIKIIANLKTIGEIVMAKLFTDFGDTISRNIEEEGKI